MVASDYGVRYCVKTPIRTSPLRAPGGSEAKIQELIQSAHPIRYQEVLRMPLETFPQSCTPS
jgi:hypothetical protein